MTQSKRGVYWPILWRVFSRPQGEVNNYRGDSWIVLCWTWFSIQPWRFWYGRRRLSSWKAEATPHCGMTAIPSQLSHYRHSTLPISQPLSQPQSPRPWSHPSLHHDSSPHLCSRPSPRPHPHFLVVFLLLLVLRILVLFIHRLLLFLFRCLQPFRMTSLYLSLNLFPTMTTPPSIFIFSLDKISTKRE